MALVCPYCRTEVAPEAGEGKYCDGCGTPHHNDCLEENGGCTLFGCKFAPPDDPKVQITASDAMHGGLSGVGIMPTPPRPPAAAPMPAVAARAAFGDVHAVTYAPAIDTAVPPPPPPPPAPGGATQAPAGSAMPAAMPVTAYAPAAGTMFAAHGPQAKARLTYILLGILLGVFGVHNFYAGYVKRGAVQLALTLLTFFYASVIVWIWAVVEVCTVESDNNNINFI